MSKVVETVVYDFAELSERAKNKARAWYREGALNYDWWDFTYEDAKNVGLKITAFDLDRNRHCEGALIEDACYTARTILASHGEKCETYTLASEFLGNRDRLVAAWPKDANGEFVDERAMDEALDDIELEFLRALLEAYAVILQKEYDWLLSDEQVDGAILANEYTFTAAGERFG